MKSSHFVNEFLSQHLNNSVSLTLTINKLYVITMKKPQLLGLNQDLTLAIADWYEYAMAKANHEEGIAGQTAVFDMVVRRMPTNKVVGKFEHEGVTYDKLQKRDFLINAGLEQVAAYFLEARGTTALRKYVETVQGIQDHKFLNWVENAK